jgi:hypothetical protein
MAVRVRIVDTTLKLFGSCALCFKQALHNAASAFASMRILTYGTAIQNQRFAF